MSITTVVLPQRTGDRPRTRPVTPHQQLSQNAPISLQEQLWQRMAALDDVRVGRSGVSLPDTRALHLEPARAAGPPQAFPVGTEFAHLHGARDGSLHMALPVADVAEAVAKGWAEPHPFVLTGMLPRNYVMVYGPRDEAELETVWALVQRSYAFAAGDLLVSTRDWRCEL